MNYINPIQDNYVDESIRGNTVGHGRIGLLNTLVITFSFVYYRSRLDDY